MENESVKRSVVKTVSWRVIATALMFVTVWFFTGAFYVSLVSSVVAGVINTIAYYLHERLWNKTKWGKVR